MKVYLLIFTLLSLIIVISLPCFSYDGTSSSTWQTAFMIVLAMVIFLASGLSIFALVTVFSLKGKFRDLKSVEELENNVKHDLDQRYKVFVENLNNKIDKRDINDLKNNLDSLGLNLSKDKEEIKLLKEDIKRLESSMSRSIAELSVTPEVNLFVSSLRDFANEIIEVYYEQDKGIAQRIGLGNYLMELDVSFSKWRKDFMGKVSKLRGSNDNSGTANQRILNFAFDLLQKSEDYNRNLQKLKITYTDFETGIKLPSFKEYWSDFLKDKDKMGIILSQKDCLYTEVVKGYSRLTAGEIIKTIGKGLDTREFQSENLRFSEDIRLWINNDLILLSDYVNSFYEELDKVKPELSSGIYSDLSPINSEFQNFLGKIDIYYINIRLKEDIFNAELHEISRRMDKGQTILKIEKQGIKWRNEVLRKALVWVG